MRTPRKFLALAAALGAMGLAASAHAAVIYPVSAIGSSSYPGYPDADAIDMGAGADVSDWASFGEGNRSVLDLDLGGVYALDKAFVTDRVTSGGGNNVFVGGLYDFTTQFSLQAFTDASFTTAIGAAQVFNHAAPNPHTSPANFLDVVSLGGLTTEFVQYKVLAANGSNPGLSDIHFTGAAAVPEPAAWALMILGFGAAGALLRHRRGARATLV
jgi:hypothetical protein